MSEQEGDRPDAPEAPAAAAPKGVPREAVDWGFKLLAGRAPVNPAEFEAFKALPNLTALRRAFTNTESFHEFFDSVLNGYPSYTVPLFLLRPPATTALDWRFAPPDLEQPGSQLCTASQFADPVFSEIIEAMGVRPTRTRAKWEHAWMISVLATAGLIAPGRRGLAIDAARERVASLVASRGAEVLAIGSETGDERAMEARRSRLFYPEIIHIEEFDRLVRFAAFEPTAIGSFPEASMDFCFSFGMPGRLRSIEATLAFLEASLAPLRPGGLALHCLDFNLTSDKTTWELPNLVILRRSDIETLAERLAPAGHRIIGFNTHPGTEQMDEQVSAAPTSTRGHRQRHGVVVATSFGLAIRKAG
jgi:hypothetical protein